MSRFLLLLLMIPCAASAQLERWVDERGVVHLMGRGAAVEAPREAPVEGAPEGRVARVVDGDTVHLKGGMKLRLIGINAPEVAHRNRPGEPGGEAARRFLDDRLKGARVTLELDAERRDRYGRELVHLRDEHGVLINELLLREGHAHLAPHPPNLLHIERYAAAESEARAARRGIWAHPRFAVIDAAEAGEYRNSFRRLRGRIIGVEWRGRAARLLLDGVVELRLGWEYLEPFRDAGLDPAGLKGREAVVRGWLDGRRGHPSLRLVHPLQIEEIDPP